MITGINAVVNWLGSIIAMIIDLDIPSGIGNQNFKYIVVILFMFLTRISYKLIKMFLSKEHNQFAKNGKD